MTISQDLALHLEGAPTDDQKERLEDFLSELMLLSRKYKILLSDEHETTQLLDVRTMTLIGLGLVFWTAPGEPRRVVSYTPADSILDGTWLVDTEDGPLEQQQVMNVFPQREPTP